jgi:hypothetical protein
MSEYGNKRERLVEEFSVRQPDRALGMRWVKVNAVPPKTKVWRAPEHYTGPLFRAG